MLKFFFVLILTSHALSAWGLRGHRIVARIAENHLSEAARSKVKELLGEEYLERYGTHHIALIRLLKIGRAHV